MVGDADGKQALLFKGARHIRHQSAAREASVADADDSGVSLESNAVATGRSLTDLFS